MNEYILEEFLSKLRIPFESKGNDLVIQCKSSLHQDNSPSMRIGKSFPFPIYCFGCKYSGSLVKNSKDLFGIHFFEVMDKNKIDTSSVEYFRESQSKKKLSRRVKQQIDFFGEKQSIVKNKIAFDYVKSRNISDDFIRFFNCFYVEKASIVVDNEESNWYKRLCIPIYDRGNLISIEGRDVTRKSPVKCLYPKKTSLKRHLFNYENIDESKSVYITEGVMGLSSIWQIDKNVISTYGKCLSDEQKDLISKLKKIIVIPDNDWNKNKDNLKDTLEEYDSFYAREYEVVVLEKIGSDPNDYSLDDLKKILVESKYSSSEVLVKKYMKNTLLVR